MKCYKRRTLALVLASVVTVVGALGSGNFKNSIKSLKFESTGSGSVNVTIMTKYNFEQSITPVKKDSTTYVITLPDINDESEDAPELTSGIESVDIRTMPYTKTSNGYTKITFKTVPNILLKTQKALYIPEKEKSEQVQNNASEKREPAKEQDSVLSENNNYNTEKAESYSINDSQNTNNHIKNQNQFTENNVTSKEPQQEDVNQFKKHNSNKSNTANDSFEIMMILMGALLIIVSSIYWFIKHNNKIAEIIGEQPDFDIDYETEKKAEILKEHIENKKKIKNTIRNLDKMYKSPLKMPTKPDIIPDIKQEVSVNDASTQEDSTIVDLDELFNEVNQQDTINDNLDDFLNEYYNAENEEKKLQEEKAELERYNEELFNKFINDDSIKFSKSDMEKIDRLLKTELSDELLELVENIEKSTPKNSDDFNISRVDKMITEYTVNQNITFTKEDVDALDKLMNVELDRNFVTDLRTDSKRTEEMTWEILNRDIKKHNTREIITLRVKDILPDLTKELEMHGKNRIESNAKPEVIYADDRYEVSKIEINDELLKDNKETDEIEAQKPIPEEHYDYDILTLESNIDLPDMEDVRKNPKKYEEKKQKAEVDEEFLRHSIDDVKFKPIYDGTETTDIFDNIDTNNTSTDKPNNIIETKDEISDLTETITQNQIKPTEKAKLIKDRKNNDNAQKLLEMIEQKKEQHRIIRENRMNKINEQKTSKKESVSKNLIPKECVVDGKTYQILASSSFDNHVGCYLATSEEDGYSILGFMGDKIFKVKHYEKIDNSKLQTRVSKKLNDGSIRYIVRIGIHKFILDVNDEKMEYVMDLC